MSLLANAAVIDTLGWVNVCKNDSAPSFWNQLMREKRHVATRWRHGGLIFDQAWDRRTHRKEKGAYSDTLDNVQLTTVYPLRELTEKRAAKAAWKLFLAGDERHTEWYDASADKHWTKLFQSTR